VTPAHRNEPDADPSPAASPAPRAHTRWRLGTPLVVLVSGTLFAVSAVNSGGTDLRPGRYTDLASLTEAESRTYQGLQAEAAELKTEVDQLTGDVVDDDVRRAERKAARLKGRAGLEEVSGTGVTVVLSDAPEDVLIHKLEEAAQDDPDAAVDTTPYVVHQQDIQAVVNALWLGGAQAVTIQGQRIVTTTGIKCSGSTVQLQGVPYPQPYTIQAVGDPGALVDALDADVDVSGFRYDAADPEVGVGWDLTEDDDVEAPAYTGLLDIDLAKPQRG
jgi:uncharacterized protein YlxW (UPF0749 family)